ncbi:serine/threonine protein kinase [Hyphomicrobium methylovorum]|uniref:serine/threonine-protein kinase n=1 Tax=Hyphomicrobium methylovorum TaxID=84 RepID=UPI0015E7C724|nr:serine/threonine-protein kinase [Hyphomicrobium methylovorum]MBA2125987.1 serine/threonine protein kinase [Hyphomicrobium methylovorum]
MSQLVALPDGTELAGDYKIVRVLGAGGFGVTYLAEEPELTRQVSIKEYFPSDFASRTKDLEATPRSAGSTSDYNWGLDRFIEEAQTLAKFDHHNIVKVFRIFRANNTAYMVLRFEEGKSLKTWLKELGRAPRQKELDQIVAPLLDALEVIHKADFLHRDIAPDNIIIRSNGDPVLIDFGAARSDIAAHSKTKTVSALVKPGYSPYEQYAETSRQQGPWTDIYAFAATLYHAVTGKRPPDSPSRMLKDEMVPVREAALGGYRSTFLEALQQGLTLAVDGRPKSVAAWRGALMAPEPERPGIFQRFKDKTEVRRRKDEEQRAAEAIVNTAVPPPPDAPGPKGGLLDFVDSLKSPAAAVANPPPAPPIAKKPAASEKARAEKADKPKAEKKAAEKRAPLPPPPRPAAEKRSKSRARPKPDVASRPLTRGLKSKLIIAAGLAAFGFAFHDRLPQLLLVQQSNITTGALPAAPSSDLLLRQAAEIKAHDTAIVHLAISGDGRHIITGAKTPELRVWSFASQQPTGTIALDDGPATAIAVRNNRVATGHANGAVAIYDLDSKRRLFHFKRNDARIWSVVFAGSEDRVAAAGHDWAITLWETSSESAPAAVLEGSENAVQALASDPSGQWLASGGADRIVRLWNLETRDVRRVYRSNADFISALAFSGDGGSIASGALDGAVKMLSTANNRTQRQLDRHPGSVTAVAFSAPQDLLASASEDGLVRLRSLKRPRTVIKLPGTNVGAESIAFTNDGHTLLTGGRDGVLRFWTLPDALVAQSN